jgi:hypothetical protein
LEAKKEQKKLLDEKVEEDERNAWSTKIKDRNKLKKERNREGGEKS